jgi:maltooligosyltrehalose trehalohydrolase
MRGPFDVWAPKPERLRLVLGNETLDMRRGADDWWTPVEPTPDVSAGEVDYGYLVDDAETRRRTPGPTRPGQAASSPAR